MHDRGSGRGRDCQAAEAIMVGVETLSGDANTPMDRPFKLKNQYKTSQADHNRKRGHDERGG